ncbi:hypothetical protein [Desulfobotulus mexicanus]|uniref:Diaminopimelate epimerase n=1 Tax=Desulfobotulus mexicanus TaxID=2586642 RepID=A0A5Q4VIC5_9BACT|nr:hypothetical protein [Desulfobotulus mexicanus]TYT75920.1 hypothetical protein FIM25_03215 [Desulfobotulus mexicanus]
MRLPFIKMHVCGNNFIFVDELGRDPMPDALVSDLAKKLTDPYTGVGADGLIRLGGVNPSDSSGISFRLLKPDGSESLSCGNGLLCAGRYLADRYGVKQTVFQTQIPTGRPVAVVSGETGGKRWIRVPAPGSIPDFLFRLERHEDIVTPEGRLVFNLQSRRKAPLFMENSEDELSFVASPVFAGEPHLVVRDSGIVPKERAGCLFPEMDGAVELRRDWGNLLLCRMGGQISAQYPGLFPKGINLMVARSSGGGEIIFFRSFKSGNLRETMACGTGALACAAVLGKGDAIRVVPEMARRHMGALGYTIIPGKNEWYIYGDPELIWEGIWTGCSPFPGEV